MSEKTKSFTTEKYVVTYTVNTEADGLRLDQFLMDHFKTFSREKIKLKINRGEVTISNRKPPHRPSAKVHYGDIITIETKKSNFEDEFWNGELIELEKEPEIVFEDSNLIAISKPPFMSTHPTGKHLFYCATVIMAQKTGSKALSIHRLDRETSGVLLLGKNPETASLIGGLFEERLVEKCYFFIAEIAPNFNAALFPLTANERLGRDETGITRLLVKCFPENSEEGKKAKTFFHLLYHNESYAIGLAFPKTGRQHQIRAHAAFYGLPLLGDKLYNGDATIFTRFKDGVATESDHQKMQLPRHALHATALRLEYPINSSNKKVFKSKIPSDLKNWVEKNIPVKVEKIEQLIEEKIKAVWN